MKGGEANEVQEAERHGRETSPAREFSTTQPAQWAATSRCADVICKKPFRKGVMEFGCGQCTPCRINKQREWVSRLQLELLTAPAACFVTLTYDDEHLPENGELRKTDIQLWMKRLRERLKPIKLRYFLVGEYGEKTFRPHYHAILYGVTPAASELISSAWTLGFVHVGSAEKASMSYVCGYVLKKMTKATDKRLNGRPPEFATMSKQEGGIGYKAVNNLAAAYRSSAGQAALQEQKWITTSVRIGPKIYPMGRYIAGKLAENLGLTTEDRKAYNYRRMLQTFVEKSKLTTTAYEKRRKARVEQQEGKAALSGANWRRTF